MSTIDTILVENHDQPYATFNLVVRSGALRDPKGQEGRAYLAANMLMRGTQKRTQEQIAEDVDFLGSLLDVYVGKESTFLRGDALKRNFDALLEVLGDVVSSSTFPQEELDKLRRQTQAELRDLRNHDEALARHFFYHLLYDGHPFGRPTKGTAESLERISRDDVVGYIENTLRRSRAFVAASGDLDREELDGAVARHVGTFPSDEGPEQETPEATRAPGRTMLLVDKPERTQTQVVMGHLCIDATDPDYFPLLVANTIFGGTFTARMSREIREKRGWSYGAYSYLSPSRTTGSFSMRFYPKSEDTRPAVELALSMLEELVAEGVTEKELAFAKSYLTNHFPFKIDASAKRLEQLITGKLLGWPADFLDAYIDNVQRTTREGIHAALRRHVHPDDIQTTVVCTADAVRTQLAGIRGVERVMVQPHEEDWRPGSSLAGGE